MVKDVLFLAVLYTIPAPVFGPVIVLIWLYRRLKKIEFL